MLMDTFKTIEDALTKELWNFLDHFEDMGLINSDMAGSLWYHKEKGMEYLNPKPEAEPEEEEEEDLSFSETIYYCDICKCAMASEPMTDGYMHICENCNQRSRT